MSIENDRFRLIFRPWQEYVVPYVAAGLDTALVFHQELFEWEPSEKVTLRVVDWWHYGNAFATAQPRNRVWLGLAPNSHAMETYPTKERISSMLSHEVVHLATSDKATGSDRFFRSVFGGKVLLSSDDPVTLLYSHLTTPRYSTPRWYREGIASYLETWMGGGYGRALGPYDEMVFRSKVLDGERLFDFVGLESEGTTVGVDAGANSYLYGTRFVSYLAHTYGHDRLISWYNRSVGSKPSYLSQFKRTFGKSLGDGWNEWLEWERTWQEENLERIRQHPTSDYRVITNRALGRVSRGFLTSDGNELIVAMSYPGEVAQIAAIDIPTGRIRRITEIIGASGLNVTSLAYDRTANRVFYTTNIGDFPHLKRLDLNSGDSKMLMPYARVGDLVFDEKSNVLWGVEHFNGRSAIVRIPPPYDEAESVFELPFGEDIYDLDVSPDGTQLVGSKIEITGKQFLVQIDVASLMRGDAEVLELFEFGNWEPQNFTYSADGRYLFGSSYYSGVSNIYRYDVLEERMQPLSNAETGFFRPVPRDADSLVAFRYSAKGFVPVMIPNKVPERVSAIKFLGNEIARSAPEVPSWSRTVQEPEAENQESLDARPYRPLANVSLSSIYPIVHGYEDIDGTLSAAVGLRANLADHVGRVDIQTSALYSPNSSLKASERVHASLEARYRTWTLGSSYNRTDFYDLFGPTTTSRKGFNAYLGYSDILFYDAPKIVQLSATLDAWTGIATLPEFQDVASTITELVSLKADLSYDFLRKSIGAIEDELGLSARIGVRSNYANQNLFPRAFAEVTYGILLPLNHSSLWLRGAAGTSFNRDRNQPFSRFYFGGFGNNWVDHGSVRRYRDYTSFPGAEINTLSGTNFGKVQAEWVLPPLRFRRVGIPNMYFRWASLSLFAGGLVTEMDSRFSDLRRRVVDAGAQLDFRLVTLSRMDSTISFGYAVIFEDGESRRDEWMISLKIL